MICCQISFSRIAAIWAAQQVAIHFSLGLLDEQRYCSIDNAIAKIIELEDV